MTRGYVAGWLQLAGNIPELFDSRHGADFNLVLFPGKSSITNGIPEGPARLEVMLRSHDDFWNSYDTGREWVERNIDTLVGSY